MKRRFAVVMAAALGISMLSQSVVFAEADTMTMEEVIAAVKESEVPSDIKLGYVIMNLANPWFVQVGKGFDVS